MEVKVCRGCKKMFQYIAGAELCPRCKQIEEEHFQKVKEYLRGGEGGVRGGAGGMAGGSGGTNGSGRGTDRKVLTSRKITSSS